MFFHSEGLLSQVSRKWETVTGHFAVGFFAVGHFAVGHFVVGHFAVRTLRRKDVSPWDISPYFSPCWHFALGNVSVNIFLWDLKIQKFENFHSVECTGSAALTERPRFAAYRGCKARLKTEVINNEIFIESLCFVYSHPYPSYPKLWKAKEELKRLALQTINSSRSVVGV